MLNRYTTGPNETEFTTQGCQRQVSDTWKLWFSQNYRRHETFKEAATRMTNGASYRILAVIYNIVIVLIIQAGYNKTANARCCFADHLDQASPLLITSNSPPTESGVFQWLENIYLS